MRGDAGVLNIVCADGGLERDEPEEAEEVVEEEAH